MSRALKNFVPFPNPDLALERADDGRNVLVNGRTNTYTEVSEAVAIVWSLCDGNRSVDGIAAHLKAMKAPGAYRVAQRAIEILASVDAIASLPHRGMGSAANGLRDSPLLRLTNVMKRILTVRVSYKGADFYLDLCYRGALRWFYARSSLVALVLLAVASLGVFPLLTREWPAISLIKYLPLIIAFEVGTLLLHELAHAMTVKHYGRKVLSVGVGWFWVEPIAFVDTTDMWLASRWARVAVSLAGPTLDLSIAGCLCCIAIFSDPEVAALAVLLASCQWLKCAYNMSPFLEYDGYYALSNILNKPHLRRDSFTWLFQIAGRKPGWLHKRFLTEIAYSVLSLIYLGVLLGLQAHYALFALHKLFGLNPQSLTAATMVFASLLVATSLIAAGLWGDIRHLVGQRATPDGSS